MAPRGEKRAYILDVALTLFAERGFHGTSVGLIAKQADTGPGTIYHYFVNKEGLVNTLYRQWSRARMEMLLQLIDPEAPPREQFASLWQGLTQFTLAHPEAMTFLELHHHRPYLEDESLEIEDGGRAKIRELVKRAQAQEVIVEFPAENLLAMVTGAFVGLIKNMRNTDGTVNTEVLGAAEVHVWNSIRR